MNHVLKNEIVESVSSTSPVLAILTTVDGNGIMRGNRKNFIDIISTGKDMGFTVYVLPVQNLSFQRQLQLGYVYVPSMKRWSKKLMPFPNVIYNRIPLRADEKNSLVKNKLQACRKNPNIVLFNPYFFNKWELFRWLNKARSTKAFIPVTKRLTTSANLEKMLQSHSFLYLKPESGKAGKGIMTVVKKSESVLPYHLNIQQKTHSTTYSCSSFKKLWARIQSEMGTTPYIAQQGIQLATYYNRKFDLRALIQKNSNGNWEVTGLGARIAGSQSITTHVPRGGSIDDPLKLLTHAFNAKEAHSIIDKVYQATITIAGQIERGAKYKLGEMSMDIGVDQQGNVWFFEANSKPMKFDEPHIRKKSLQRIFQYSQHLLNQ